MEVERDFDNVYDEFAMKVSMPDATKVKAGLLDAITRPEKRGRPCQRVKDVTGKVVGHIPANLGELFVQLKDKIVRISWLVLSLLIL